MESLVSYLEAIPDRRLEHAAETHWGVHACFSVLKSESTSKEYTLVPCKRELNGMSVISYEVRVVLSEVNIKVPLINFFLGILNNGNPEREEVLDHLDDIANSSLGIKGTLPLLASAEVTLSPIN